MTSQKTIAINGDDLYHEFSRHSGEKEMSRDQIPLTIDDFVFAIKSIYNPDYVECLFSDTFNPTQRQSFVYVKKKEEYYIVVEVVGGKRNPNITPAMIVKVTDQKWKRWIIDQKKTIGEIIHENAQEMLDGLDIEENKKNRVTAAQFASNEAIANTPRSPQFTTIISDQNQKNNWGNAQNFEENDGQHSLRRTGAPPTSREILAEVFEKQAEEYNAYPRYFRCLC